MRRQEYPITKVLNILAENNLLPAILFRTSRKQCDSDVEVVGSSRIGKVDPEQSAAIESMVEKFIARHNVDPEVITTHPHYNPLIKTAVGAHHAGQLLLWRLLLEELMSAGKLRMLVATSTVAAGVDFPARTVVITAHSKRGSDGFAVLTSSELQQMSGRAGRRGKDNVGICLITPGLFSDARVLSEVADRPPEPLRSAYFASPSTALNLLKHRTVTDLRFTVERSLAAFQDRERASELRSQADLYVRQSQDLTMSEGARKRLAKRSRQLLRDAEVLENSQLSLLEVLLEKLRRLGYLEGERLSEKGSWAAELCTSLVLELAEAISFGVFDDLSVDELVGLVASISGDEHRRYYNLSACPISKDLFKDLQQALDHLKLSEAQAPTVSGYSSQVVILPEAATTVVGWMRSETWLEFVGLLRLAGVAEGDVARLVSQTADHLNQIARLTLTHSEIARKAEQGRELLLRPPLAE